MLAGVYVGWMGMEGDWEAGGGGGDDDDFLPIIEQPRDARYCTCLVLSYLTTYKVSALNQCRNSGLSVLNSPPSVTELVNGRTNI